MLTVKGLRRQCVVAWLVVSGWLILVVVVVWQQCPVKEQRKSMGIAAGLWWRVLHLPGVNIP